jgi:type 2 lantibiotic biosynthesis protein LanM
VDTARRGLAREVEEAGLDAGFLSPEAWLDLTRSLAGRLTALAGRALQEEFDRFRGGPPEGLTVRLAEAGVRRSTERYQAFVAERSADWVETFPVLARLTGQAVEDWRRNTLEMLLRLREDAAALGHPGRVLRVEANLSDLHDGGRSVHVLTFEGGFRIVYKPRGLGPERAFNELLAWCGAQGLPLAPHGHRVLDRGSHGWAEFVAPEPCADAEAARRFHVRAGILLALLHAFGSRDVHFENLVARGEHPVLVDLEAWLPAPLRKWLPGEALGEAWYEAARRIERSVLSTGLLPRWQEGRRRGKLRDVSGLGGGRPGRRLQPVWLNVNSDAMVRVWTEAEIGLQANVPTLDGEPLDPRRYLSEVSRGFEDAYRFLLRHREELLSGTGPLGALAGVRTRLILRSTAVYNRLLERSLSPRCCRDAAARDAELDALARAFPGAENQQLLAAERRALEHGDIPLFLVPVDDTLDGALAMSSLEAIRANLSRLDEADLDFQLGFLRAALASGGPAVPGPEPEDAGPTDRDQLLAAARTIASRLRDTAIQGDDGSLAWIGPRRLGEGDLYELSVLGPDLYGGTAGIALFLAAVHRVLGDAEAGELCLRALAPVRARLALRTSDPGLGGLTGIGSFIYAFLWIGELLGEPALAREAHALTNLLTPEKIAGDDRLDVISGSAGTLLALLSLDRVAPGPNATGRTPIDLAILCARHLLDRPAPPGPAGFAHGVEGVRHALLRLAERTGWQEAREAALGLRGPALSGDTWCRGAPGVALTLDGREESRSALEVTRTAPLSPIDHLCCGNMGRAEVLLHAAKRLNDERLHGEALALAGRVLRRAGPTGRFGCLPNGGGDLFDPSFFKGEAGIGFGFLRLATSGVLPCPLLLAEMVD